jgi:hypothetical protein
MNNWQLSVADAMGRPRAVGVDTYDHRITVTTPPGEGFSMNPDEADQLAAALLAASSRARQVGARR